MSQIIKNVYFKINKIDDSLASMIWERKRERTHPTPLMVWGEAKLTKIEDLKIREFYIQSYANNHYNIK